MMEAVRTYETSVNFNVTTRRYIPEDSKLHTRRCENLKSPTLFSFYKQINFPCCLPFLPLTFKNILKRDLRDLAYLKRLNWL
jgi:hypothetical protein